MTVAVMTIADATGKNRREIIILKSTPHPMKNFHWMGSILFKIPINLSPTIELKKPPITDGSFSYEVGIE